MSEVNRFRPGSVRIPAIVVALVAAALCLGIYFAGTDDIIHNFEDQYGERQVALSTDIESRLLPAFFVSSVLLGAIWVLSSGLASRITGLPLRDTLRLDAVSYFPLLLLLLVPLRYIPGLAQFSNALFLLSTTLAQWLLLGAALLVVALKIYLFRGRSEPHSLIRSFFDGLSERATGTIVFALLMVTLIITIPQFSAAWPFGGDEPHYLIVTHSLLEDGDIYFQDEYDAGVYRRFSQWQFMTPQYLRLTRDDRAVPIHRIGISLMAVPAYAIAGKLGAVLMIGFFAALAAANLYWLVIKVIPDRKAALFAVAWVALSIPMLPLSFMFYTEVPLACFILLSLNLIVRADGKQPRWPWAIPFVIWFLPWIHARGYVTAVALSIFLVVRLRKRLPVAAGVATLCLVLAIAIPAWNWWLYGEFSLLAEMGRAQYKDLSISNVFRNLGGLLFDQEFGLLLHNPAVVPALIGCVPLLRRKPSAFAWILLVVVCILGPGLAYHMWWGGDSSPARYAAPIMPIAAVPLAALFAAKGWGRWKKLTSATAIFSIALAIILMMNPGIVTNQRDGTSRMLTAVSVGHFDAVEWWPSWFAPAQQFWTSVAVLVLSIAVCSVLVLSVYKLTMKFFKRSGLSRLASASAAAFTAFIVCLVAYGWIAEGLTPGEPNGWEPHHRWTDLAYQARYRRDTYAFVDQNGKLKAESLPGRGFSASRLFSGWALTSDEQAEGGRSYRIETGAKQLELRSSTPFWAGNYQLLLNLRAEGEIARVSITVFDESEIGLDNWNPLAEEVVDLGPKFELIKIPIEISTNSAGLRIILEAGAPLRFTHAGVDAISLDKLGDWKLPEPLFDLFALRFNDYTLFTGPHSIYVPDGKRFWTYGDSVANLVIVSDRRFSSVRLDFVGHPPVSALVRHGGFEEQAVFSESPQRKTINLPVQPVEFQGDWLADLRIETKGFFVPAEIVEGSEDSRQLGVHTRITVGRRR